MFRPHSNVHSLLGNLNGYQSTMVEEIYHATAAHPVLHYSGTIRIASYVERLPLSKMGGDRAHPSEPFHDGAVLRLLL